MPENAGDIPAVGVDQPPRRKRWWHRMSVAQIRAEQAQVRPMHDKWDAQQNADSRLPDDESVHLGGIALIEAFTPSTVSNLYGTLRKWPDGLGRIGRGEVDRLERSGSGAGGGWTNLGVIRPPGAFVFGSGFSDPRLPNGVSAVWLKLIYLTPSVAIVTATFTLQEDVADISDILRQDHHTTFEEINVHVNGHFGWLRERLPWSRPKLYRVSAKSIDSNRHKRNAVERRAEALEDECAQWFFAKFHGRFAIASPDDRPVIRLMFTDQERPFDERHDWEEPASLDWLPPVFRCSDVPGWGLRTGRGFGVDRRHLWIVAGRRSDLLPRSPASTEDRSDWYLTQRFSEDQSSLMALHGLGALLDLYAGRLAQLRDTAATFCRRRVETDPLAADWG